jgi:hypothetical protein
MKKLILSVTAIAGFSMAAFAQGTITFDASANTSTDPGAATGGLVFIGGVLDTANDINAELLYSSTAGGTYSPVVFLSLASNNSNPTSAIGATLAGAGDVSSFSGALYDNSGSAFIIPTIGAGSTAYFEVSGNVTLNGTTYSGTTSPFAVVLTSTTAQPQANIDAMPALNLVNVVPEPSTLAMAGVGLASMLLFRRKNS